MSTQSPGKQRFVHVAIYRLEDLRAAESSGNPGLGPDVFEGELTATLATTLSTRLTNVCEQHGWQVIDISTFPDRIEAFITGVEPDGENGEAVATALDGAVYGGMSPRTAAGMN